MAKPKASVATIAANAAKIQDIRKTGILAMFSDDDLMDELVLKGGNAMDIVYHTSNRSSVDLDFSMEKDFPEGFDALASRITNAITKVFLEKLSLQVFDAKVLKQPKGNLTDPEMEFWGGYGVEFKLIDKPLYEQYAAEPEKLRKLALNLGQGPKFLIDISKHEYVAGKRPTDLDGYRIYVYSPEMIVCEKLRAICQTTREYGPIVQRSRAEPKGRAKDFLDIYLLIEQYKINLSSEENILILKEMFSIKKVPLNFLDLMEEYKELHKTDFPSVQATVKPGAEIKDFDYYFDYCLRLRDQLRPLWNE